MNVHIVTKGEYSDYSILGVFSTPTKAVDYINKMNEQSFPPDRPDIEVWPVDVECSKVLRQSWYLAGNLITAEFDPVFATGEPGAVDRGTYMEAPNRRSDCSIANGHFYAVSWVSPEHAQKLVTEAFQSFRRWQAMNNTVPGRKTTARDIGQWGREQGFAVIEKWGCPHKIETDEEPECSEG